MIKMTAKDKANLARAISYLSKTTFKSNEVDEMLEKLKEVLISAEIK